MPLAVSGGSGVAILGTLSNVNGGTGSNLGATGPGFLKQASSGANVTVVSTLANTDVAQDYIAVKIIVDSNITIGAPPASFDSYTFVDGDLICLSGQSTASQNGLWTYHASGLVRPAIFASANTTQAFWGLTFYSVNGATRQGELLMITTTGTITIDTTSITIAEIPVYIGSTNAVVGLLPITRLGPLTPAKGDIIASNGSFWQDQAHGSDGQVLISQSSQTNGVQWVGQDAIKNYASRTWAFRSFG
jgi:hypothetical protein